MVSFQLHNPIFPTTTPTYIYINITDMGISPRPLSSRLS